LSRLIGEDGKRIDINEEDFNEMKKLDTSFGISKDEWDTLTPEERMERERSSYI